MNTHNNVTIVAMKPVDCSALIICRYSA